MITSVNYLIQSRLFMINLIFTEMRFLLASAELSPLYISGLCPRALRVSHQVTSEPSIVQSELKRDLNVLHLT